MAAMIKRLLICVLLLTINMICYAQTYRYKYLYSINPQSGIKEQFFRDGLTIYITFSNNMMNAYRSDAYGIKEEYQPIVFVPGIYQKGWNEYRYKEYMNGHQYESTFIQYQIQFGGNKKIVSTDFYWMKFSPDYERLNMQNTYGKDSDKISNIHVYERMDNNNVEPSTKMW